MNVPRVPVAFLGIILAWSLRTLAADSPVNIEPVKPGAPILPASSLPSRPVPSNAAANSAPGKADVLVFDAMTKHVDLAEGEKSAAFTFAITNRSADEVTVSYINTSCGCTAGKLPSYPWKLKGGEGGYIDVTMDLTGKYGLVTKTATVVSSAGSYKLTVSAKAPPVPTAASPTVAANAAGGGNDRSRNMSVASADRQAVFRNDCATCHVQPAVGKTGHELYDTACGICHEAEHRAQMVPDLRTRLKNSDRNYWAKWIGEGRPGSLMPAFSAKHGGILSDTQLDSLVEYLETDYKKNPPPSKSVDQAAATPAAQAPGTPKRVDR